MLTLFYLPLLLILTVLPATGASQDQPETTQIFYAGGPWDQSQNPEFFETYPGGPWGRTQDDVKTLGVWFFKNKCGCTELYKPSFGLCCMAFGKPVREYFLAQCPMLCCPPYIRPCVLPCAMVLVNKKITKGLQTCDQCIIEYLKEPGNWNITKLEQPEGS